MESLALPTYHVNSLIHSIYLHLNLFLTWILYLLFQILFFLQLYGIDNLALPVYHSLPESYNCFSCTPPYLIPHYLTLILVFPVFFLLLYGMKALALFMHHSLPESYNCFSCTSSSYLVQVEPKESTEWWTKYKLRQCTLFPNVSVTKFSSERMNKVL